jgi:hypothetical protein
MTKARSSADFAAGGPQVAGKNAIINGGFDIWQRGTSFALAANVPTYTADRWYNARATAGQTVSRQVTGDTTNLPNIQYCARVQRDNANTSTTEVRIAQAIETVNSIPVAGQTITLSFYARRGANYSSASNLLGSQVYTGTGTDQNLLTGGYTGSTLLSSATPTLTTTWQRFTQTATVSATATEITVLFTYTPVGTAGANDYFEITGVQLEVGSTPTPFSRAGGTIQGELAACQRYYYRTTLAADAIAPFTNAAYSSTAVYSIMNAKVTMRTIPTSVDYSNIRLTDAVNSYTITNLGLWSVRTEDALGLLATGASGLTQYRPYILSATSSGGFIGLSAEL